MAPRCGDQRAAAGTQAPYAADKMKRRRAVVKKRPVVKTHSGQKSVSKTPTAESRRSGRRCTAKGGRGSSGLAGEGILAAQGHENARTRGAVAREAICKRAAASRVRAFSWPGRTGSRRRRRTSESFWLGLAACCRGRLLARVIVIRHPESPSPPGCCRRYGPEKLKRRLQSVLFVRADRKSPRRPDAADGW